MSETPALPPVIPVNRLAEWLPEIFPEGTSQRTYVTREIAAKTVFVMLYVGAVEGRNAFVRPDQVTKMTDLQAARTDTAARLQWAADSLDRSAPLDMTGRWYQPNTREPIRDETLRLGLVALGAVIERTDLPTTSARPRYALASHFADLLGALALESGEPATLISDWRAKHLTATALHRINLLRRAAVISPKTDRVLVSFPNGESRLMRPGPSSTIIKAVIEDFSPRFLSEPGVIFVSESGAKVTARDDELARSIGLHLDYAKNLPDVVLADACATSPKLVFVEVVATDGPINEQRKAALMDIAAAAGFSAEATFCVTAFADRAAPAFRRLIPEIAWGTYVWFLSEPDKLMILRTHASALDAC